MLLHCAEGFSGSSFLLVSHDAFDNCGIALLISEELEDPAIPCSYVCKELLQAFDAAVREGFGPFLGAVVDPASDPPPLLRKN